MENWRVIPISAFNYVIVEVVAEIGNSNITLWGGGRGWSSHPSGLTNSNPSGFILTVTIRITSSHQSSTWRFGVYKASDKC